MADLIARERCTNIALVILVDADECFAAGVDSTREAGRYFPYVRMTKGRDRQWYIFVLRWISKLFTCMQNTVM